MSADTLILKKMLARRPKPLNIRVNLPALLGRLTDGKLLVDRAARRPGKSRVLGL